MKLTDYTDYTLRTLIFLGLHRNEQVTIQQIADGYDISKNHLMKIIHRLSLDGLVETTRGRSGGVRLRKPPDEINIGQVVRAAEQEFALVECFSRVNNRCVLSPVCELQATFRDALEAFFAVLDKRTLADILRNAEEVRPYIRLRGVTVRAENA
ncbi:predicted transcriptional regulator [Aromatoleum aromaticum EbN1]|uniref:Predicted transcriptional regulator n=1 Tax=Aromatoleum aromaticum (strain DSM 19018 / LMG 30748 / EbN1) TaxID=76114 RepID=Q5P4L6_AROAE|nr:Rrf2 family transcriptional regulator [Aromatoleum aromaticum]CAI07746.1 predicted transcriptional regulator [Aromatoleum aromaticum EbN1]